MTDTVAILGTRYPDFSIEEEVLDGFHIVSGPGASDDEIVEIAGDASVILAGTLPRFSAEVFDRLPDLRAVVRAGIGVDSVDLDAARSRGLWVANVPDYGTEAVAQHTLAMALAATRRLSEADNAVKSGNWGFDTLRPLHLPSSMVVGIVGLGRIGRRVAALLTAVGFGRVVAHDPFTDPASFGYEATGLEELLANADLVCLHAPGPADGTPLIGRAELAAMKPDSVLVNTSRGSLVDSAALAEALASGRPRVAALDVFSPEPPALDPFRPVMDRLLLSPHMAWYTEESQADLRRKSAEEAKRLLSGSRPLNPIVTPEEHQ